MDSAATSLISAQRQTSLSTGGEQVSNELWLGIPQFAALASISERAARKAAVVCLNGGTWCKQHLEVSAIEGEGGQGGKSLKVYIPSLPDNLRAIWHRRNPGALASPNAEPITLPASVIIDTNIGRRVAERQWKLSIIAPALAYKKRSRGRASMLREIATTPQPGLNGGRKKIALSTLRAWLAEIERGNEKALARPPRADRGRRRQCVNRQWDDACPLPRTEKHRIAAEIETYIRGLWRSGAGSENKINSLASTKLTELSRAAGWNNATPELCTPGLHLVRQHKECQLVSIKERDAKGFHDHFTPRIQRSRESLRPLDIVIGDVHPDDVYIRREDGSIATARMIAWLDLATNDFFYSLVLLPKRRGITQAHIVQSFVDMVQKWGLPRALYLDNGSEYKFGSWVEGFRTLQGLVEAWHSFQFHLRSADEIDASAGVSADAPAALPAVTRARPHNAPAKAIEGMFAALSKFTAAIPGYVGGDRMRKRTHKLGEAPKPYPGTWEEFQRDYAEAVAFYRNEKQGGTMEGKSPNERWRDAIEAGWRPIEAGPEILLAAFADSERVRVHTGGIRCGDEWYYDDALIPMIGQMIEVQFAKWDDRFALYIDAADKYVLIRKSISYHPMDKAGAVEQGRRVGLQNAEIRRLKESAPRVDLMAEVARHNTALPAPPQIPEGMPIMLDGELRQTAKAIKRADNLPASQPARLTPGEYVDPHGEIREIFPRLAQPVAPAQLKPHIADLIAARGSPKTPKPDASADAPGSDVLAALSTRSPINHEKETNES